MGRIGVIVLAGAAVVGLVALAALVVRRRPAGRHRRSAEPGRGGFVAAGVASAAAVGAGAWAAHLMTTSDARASLDAPPPAGPGVGAPASVGAPGGPPGTDRGRDASGDALTAIANIKTTGELGAPPPSTAVGSETPVRTEDSGVPGPPPSRTPVDRRASAEAGTPPRAGTSSAPSPSSGPSGSSSSAAPTRSAEPASDDDTTTRASVPSRSGTPRPTDRDPTTPASTSTDDSASGDEGTDSGTTESSGQDRSPRSTTPEDDQDGAGGG